jgi:SAM-dependent methyltransferase
MKQRVDAEKLPLADNSIDVIYGMHGIHCMLSLKIAEFHRVLRPGGRIVFGYKGDIKPPLAAHMMTAAGFVDVKIGGARLKWPMRWTPVVGVKAR